MIILALTATWASAAPHHTLPAMSTAPVPAMAPYNEDGILLLDDKHYALHGEIMMVVLIVLFIAFVSCLAVVTRLRRARAAVEEDFVSKKPCNCFELLCCLVRRKRNKGDEDAALPEAPLRGNIEIPESTLPHQK